MAHGMVAAAGMETQRDGVGLERARLFALLGRLLVAPPDASLLSALAGLAEGPSMLGAAYGGLARAAAATDPARAGREYHDLFIGVGRGELVPFGSYYLTGFLHDRPLADLRDSLARLGIERAAGVVEPEDHAGSVCEAYAGLLSGAFPAGADGVDGFFDRHLRPWVGRFFTDLEQAGAARFYRAVGTLGRVAIDIEQAARELPA